MLSTPGSNTYEVSKAVVQGKMLSGRYRTAMLCRHWSNNKMGWCSAPCCHETEETLEHILLDCPHYFSSREALSLMWKSSDNLIARDLAVSALMNQPKYLMQFLLDPYIVPEVIAAIQENGSEVLI